MKKILLSLAVVLGMAAMANAQEAQKGQWLVGGDINFNVNAFKRSSDGDPVAKTSGFGFNFNPRAGYIINEKWEVGLQLAFGYNLADNFIINADKKTELDTRDHTFSFAAVPYATYRIFEVKGFAVNVRGQLALGTQMEPKTHQYENSATSAAMAELLNKTADGHKYSYFAGNFAVLPVLTYDINEHWRLELPLNLLSLNLGGSVESSVAATGAPKQTINQFGFDLGLRQGQTVGFGAVYKF